MSQSPACLAFWLNHVCSITGHVVAGSLGIVKLVASVTVLAPVAVIAPASVLPSTTVSHMATDRWRKVASTSAAVYVRHVAGFRPSAAAATLHSS